MPRYPYQPVNSQDLSHAEPSFAHGWQFSLMLKVFDFVNARAEVLPNIQQTIPYLSLIFQWLSACHFPRDFDALSCLEFLGLLPRRQVPTPLPDDDSRLEEQCARPMNIQPRRPYRNQWFLQQRQGHQRLDPSGIGPFLLGIQISRVQ